ncbi:MAG: DNA polymerase I [Magnetococcales bacterium]|nr:DNA polymerase I [Magnetococcales bacterium]
MMTTPRMFLIDGSGYIYRAYYGIRNLARRDGFPTNAIFGFIKMIRKVIHEHGPDYVAMVYDPGGELLRHRLDSNYKANRHAMPDDLRAQLPVIRRLVTCWNIATFEQKGYEADDLIGTVAKAAERAGMEVVIVSGDKDLMQIVSPNITILDPGKEVWIGPAEVEGHWGVPVAQVTQVMALMGDASDNIPGVPNIGIKTAARLIREFGDLETLLTNTHRVSQPMRRKNLTESAHLARLSLQLVTIHCDVELALDWAALRRRPPNREALRELFMEMEFFTLAKELDQTPEAEEPAGEEAGHPPLDYRSVTSEAEWQAFLQRLRGCRAFALDTETTGTDPSRARLVGLSFSWEEGIGYYLPVGHAPEAVPQGQLELKRVLAELQPILEDPAIAKTGQNLKFEYAMLRQYGIRLAGMARDSMIFSNLLYGGGRRHNLDAIALAELGRITTTFKEVAGIGKKQVTFDQVPLSAATPYACEDAEIAWLAAEKMSAALAAMPATRRLYQEVEAPLIPVLGEMELAGALMDRGALERMSLDLTRRREGLTLEIHALAGETFNINSTRQLGVILFEKLGIKGGRKTKTGHSTDVDVLTGLAEQGYELPAKVLEYRTLSKLQSTYSDALAEWIHPESGRVHTRFNQAATLTGRLSSSEPNLQNIPVRRPEGRLIRAAFIAPPGHVLLSADYSQIELRLLAHLGDVPRLKEAFAQGLDIHAATACELFGMDLAMPDPEMRRLAKTINFGLVYGMSPFGLAKRLGIAVGEAMAYMELYFRRYQGVRAHMDRTIRFAREHGYVETLGGRRCFVPDIDHTNRTLRELAERTAINAPLQGSAADLIKMAMIRLHHALTAQAMRSRMILQVHDELLLEVPDNELIEVREMVRQAMEGAMTLSVPLRVDMGAGGNWSEAH